MGCCSSKEERQERREARKERKKERQDQRTPTPIVKTPSPTPVETPASPTAEDWKATSHFGPSDAPRFTERAPLSPIALDTSERVDSRTESYTKATEAGPASTIRLISPPIQIRDHSVLASDDEKNGATTPVKDPVFLEGHTISPTRSQEKEVTPSSSRSASRSPNKRRPIRSPSNASNSSSPKRVLSNASYESGIPAKRQRESYSPGSKSKSETPSPTNSPVKKGGLERRSSITSGRGRVTPLSPVRSPEADRALYRARQQEIEKKKEERKKKALSKTRPTSSVTAKKKNQGGMSDRQRYQARQDFIKTQKALLRKKRERRNSDGSESSAYSSSSQPIENAGNVKVFMEKAKAEVSPKLGRKEHPYLTKQKAQEKKKHNLRKVLSSDASGPNVSEI
eukprot:m.140489 g.140489  ORF g.140489 m.140489 type:complete len:397 (+) comp14827_c0_seq1:307-1497(+)